MERLLRDGLSEEGLPINRRTKTEDVFKEGRCGSCRAKEVIDWLEEHIKLIKNSE